MQKAYSIFVTLLALGLLAYILIVPRAPVDARQAPSAAPAFSADANISSLPASSSRSGSSSRSSSVQSFVLNTRSYVFHKPSCGSVKQMSASNKKNFTGTRDQVIGMGYHPCQRCYP